MRSKSRPKEFTGQYMLDFTKLHEAFGALMSLKPWTIVPEWVMLGVRHPESGITYYAYFMGELGEVVGLNIYRGSEVKPWLFARRRMGDPAFGPGEMLAHTLYQLTAVKKSELPAEIKTLHAAAGIAVPRGKAGYLDAVTYRGGYAPVQMREEELDEVRVLLPGFAFLLGEIGAGRLTEYEALDDRDACYVATRNADGAWHAAEEALPEPEEANLFAAELSPEVREVLQGFRGMPRAKEDFVIHAAMLPMPIANDEGVGVFPLALFCLGADTGLILSLKMLDITSWQWKAAAELAGMLQDGGALPAQMIVADARLFPIVDECAEAMGIKCVLDERAASFTDELVGDLLMHLGR